MIKTICFDETKFDVNYEIYQNFWDIYQNNQWEPHTLKLFKKILSKDKDYIDIGSWIGPTVLYASNFSRNSYSIEPDNISFHELVINTKLNPLLKISNYNMLVGDIDGSDTLVTYTNYGDSMSSIKKAPKHYETIVDSIDVKSITLESFIKQNMKSIEDISLIKIDIEGSETIVLKQSYNFIKQYKPNIYISTHPFWFGDGDEFLNNIDNVFNFIKLYKNIYLPNFEKITLEIVYEFLKNKNALDLLLTDINY